MSAKKRSQNINFDKLFFPKSIGTKKYGLPIQDNLLSYFLFGDTREEGKNTKLMETTRGIAIYRRMEVYELLSIDYRINRLTTNNFEDNGIHITEGDLSKLKYTVSYLIYSFIFGGYQKSTYVSDSTSKGLGVGTYYFTPEYAVFRAVFFLAAEANNGIPLSLKDINNNAGIRDFYAHLIVGYGFGDDFSKISNYVTHLLRNMPSHSDRSIIFKAQQDIDKYSSLYEERRQELIDIRGEKSFFQADVRDFIQKEFGLKFISEAQVRRVVGENEVTLINDDGMKEIIKIHGNMQFDCYLKLTRSLKEYLGLDNKWIGIAVEAMGSYYHGDDFPNQQESDRKKKLICRDKNIILLEIWDDWDKSTWVSEIYRQITECTGVELHRAKLNELCKYLGD